MKLASHITCIFAIIAQIFLTSIAFAHDVTCQSSRSFVSADESKVTADQHTQSCGCCHSHATETKTSEEELKPSDLPAPCTCSSDPVSSFIAGDYSIETRERKISLIPFTSIYSGQSFLTLPNTLSLNGVLASLRDRIGKDRIKLIHLPENSGRFVSTHLSKFLL